MLIVLMIAALAVLAAAVAQWAIPRAAARRIRDRLTEAGGVADVRVAALPATRLLRERGDRLVVRGSGLTIGLGGAEAEGRAGLGALDGFGEVDIELQDFRAGPFSIAAFVLTRSGSQSYAMATQGSVKGTELVRLAAGLLGGLPVDSVIGAVPVAAPLVSREVSLSVQIELISEHGRLRVGTGGGTIAGYPAGPVATLIAAAVARRLELVP